MLFGEKMPDKNDPKYKDRYEREVSAGRKFAQATRIDKAAAKVQGFANAHRILFLVIVFGFAIGGFTWNIYRITMAYRNSRPTRTATEMQDSVLRESTETRLLTIINTALESYDLKAEKVTVDMDTSEDGSISINSISVYVLPANDLRCSTVKQVAERRLGMEVEVHYAA